MAKNNELHTLVHALTKSEKRYFRMECGSEGSNYLRLFDAIVKQKQYDESAIRKHFKGEKFLNQLHVTKNYLHHLILKSLRNFHQDMSPSARLKDILRNIEILFQKELFTIAETEIIKAEHLASKYELFSGMIEVQEWKRKLRQMLHPFDYELFRQTLANQNEALLAQQNIFQYWSIALDLSDRKIKGTEKPRAKLLQAPTEALSLEAKVLFYNTVYLRDIMLGKSEKAKNHLVELLQLLESKPDRLKEEPGFYTTTLNNLLGFLTYNREYTNAYDLINKAQQIYRSWNITSENRVVVKQILRTYNIELELHRQQKNLSNNPKISHAESFVQRSRNKMPKEYLISFWFQFASIYFMLRNFDRSLHYINLVLNSKFNGTRRDLTAQIHILNLMVHFEKQNIFVLRYFIDSTRRYLKKSKKIQPFEQILLKFLTRIIRLPENEYETAFHDLNRQLFPPDEKALVDESALDYIDFKSWIKWHLK